MQDHRMASKKASTPALDVLNSLRSAERAAHVLGDLELNQFLQAVYAAVWPVVEEVAALGKDHALAAEGLAWPERGSRGVLRIARSWVEAVRLEQRAWRTGQSSTTSRELVKLLAVPMWSGDGEPPPKMKKAALALWGSGDVATVGRLCEGLIFGAQESLGFQLPDDFGERCAHAILSVRYRTTKRDLSHYVAAALRAASWSATKANKAVRPISGW